MTRLDSTRAPKGAGGACRKSRRRRKARGPEWVCHYRKAQRAMDAAIKLLFTTMELAVAAERRAQRCPLKTAGRLNGAVRAMAVASLRALAARRELAAATEALARDPEQQRGDAPEIMELAAERCRALLQYIPVAVNDVALVQLEILGGLSTGELVPERPADRRPRIAVTPRPLFVRAFLAFRQVRVADRITPALLRRRRTPRPAEVQVPRRNLQGRAPPLASTCAL